MMNMVDHAERTGMPLALVDLPPFPAVAVRALQLVSRHNARLQDLHEVIRADQVFSAELLRLANSPLFGIRTTVKNTLHAIALLGFERVKSLILTVAMRAYLGRALENPSLRACWRHSLACAIVAEELAKAVFLEKDFAYTAGLIHDIGRLALAVLRPQQYIDFLDHCQEGPIDLLVRERELFGIDHCEAGRFLVVAWELPEAFLDITSEHHEKRENGRFDMLAVVQAACLIAEALGFGVGGPVGIRSYEELLSELPEGVSDRLPPDQEEFAFRIAGKINSIETL